jgi:hypothetical protein
MACAGYSIGPILDQTAQHGGAAQQGRRCRCHSGQQLTAVREATLAGVAYGTELADRIRFLIGATPA